jgi:hypothetical protein
LHDLDEETLFINEEYENFVRKKIEELQENTAYSQPN